MVVKFLFSPSLLSILWQLCTDSSHSNSYQSLRTIATVQDFSGNGGHSLEYSEVASRIVLSLPSSPLLLQIVLQMESQVHCLPKSCPSTLAKPQEPASLEFPVSWFPITKKQLEESLPPFPDSSHCQFLRGGNKGELENIARLGKQIRLPEMDASCSQNIL